MQVRAGDEQSQAGLLLGRIEAGRLIVEARLRPLRQRLANRNLRLPNLWKTRSRFLTAGAVGQQKRISIVGLYRSVGPMRLCSEPNTILPPFNAARPLARP